MRGVNPADWKTREGWLSAILRISVPVRGRLRRGRHRARGRRGRDRISRSATVSSPPPTKAAASAAPMRNMSPRTASRVVKLPDHVSLEGCGRDADRGDHRLAGDVRCRRRKDGSFVLVKAVRAARGRYALQLARWPARKSPSPAARPRSIMSRPRGADLVIELSRGRRRRGGRAWAPEGVDLVVDTVGQGTPARSTGDGGAGGIVAPIGDADRRRADAGCGPRGGAGRQGDPHHSDIREPGTTTQRAGQGAGRG